MSRARVLSPASPWRWCPLLLFALLARQGLAEHGSPNLVVVPAKTLPANGRILLFSVNGEVQMWGALRSGRLALEAEGDRVPLQVTAANLRHPDRKGYGTSLWLLSPRRRLRADRRYALKARLAGQGYVAVNRFGPLGRKGIDDGSPKFSWLAVAADEQAPRIAGDARITAKETGRHTWSTIVSFSVVDTSPVFLIAAVRGPGRPFFYPIEPDEAEYILDPKGDDQAMTAYCLAATVRGGKHRLQLHAQDIAQNRSVRRKLALPLQRGELQLCISRRARAEPP